MAFIGNTPQNQSFAPAIDYFSGNGVTVTFTLSRPVVSVAQLTVAVDNVIQNPSSAFTVSGNSITFTSAPLSGTNNIWVEYTSLITTYAAISQDPSVIGDITATGGFLAEGDFGNSYIDGTIVDYVTGNARITTGPIDDMTFYHGGTSGRSEMMRLSYAGTNSYIVGNFGVGTTSPTARLHVYGGSNNQFLVQSSGAEANISLTGTSYSQIQNNVGDWYLTNGSASGSIFLRTNSTTQATITSAGLFQFNSGYGSVATAYGCRAWVNFNGTSTVAIRASGNVTSITDNGTGDYTVNFTTAMPDVNYSVAGAVNEGSTDNALPARIAQLRRTTPTTSSFRVGVSNLSNSAFDVEYVFFQVFR